jgi:hypothetical protein
VHQARTADQRRTGLVTGLMVLACVLLVGLLPRESQAEPVRLSPATPAATPGIACDAGSRPEEIQGYVHPEDFESGRAKLGYYCNARLVSFLGNSGGFRVERYVDEAGHVCAFYDSTRLLPADVPSQLQSKGLGVYAVDMDDSTKPVVTATLTTPAMVSPHESLRVNQERGLLVANMGMPFAYPGFLDVYDISKDCRNPKLASSTPLGLLGHEGGFAPDGLTYYVASAQNLLTAVDLSDPALPQVIWTGTSWKPHGVSVSNDGNTLYMADVSDRAGLTVLDVSQIQARKPNPGVTAISHLTWSEVSIPQNATPFERDGHQYLVETDEFGGGGSPIGAARIINIDDPRHPKIVSRLRLEVNNMADSSISAHYCTVPSRKAPNIVACGFIESGLRVFDIRDVERPREVAYANFAYPGSWLNQATNDQEDRLAGSVFSAPAYDPARNEIWYTDGQRGFFVLRLTPAAGIKRFARSYHLPGS